MLKRINIIAVILLIIWISFFPEPIQGKYHLAAKIILGLAFLALLIRKHGSLFKRRDFPLWVFLIAIGINVFFAQKQDIALRTYLDLAIPMFMVYYLVREGFSRETEFNLLAKTICICSILVALGGIFEALFKFNPIYEYFLENPFYRRYITGFVRPMSTQFNPAVLGSYLLASLPFNLLLFKRNKTSFKFLGALGIVLNIVVIILTFSRGVFLGLIAIVVFYLFAQRKFRLMFVFFIILLTAITIFSYLPYPFSRFGKSQMTRENRGILSDYRFSRCIMTQRIIKDHPFIGLGFQHFRIRFYEYWPRESKELYEFMIADNMYLTILAETGTIGLLGFLIFIFSFFKRGWRQPKVLKNMPQRRLQLFAALSGFTGLLVNMGAYELFYWHNPYLYFCIIVGCIGSFVRK